MHVYCLIGKTGKGEPGADNYFYIKYGQSMKENAKYDVRMTKYDVRMTKYDVRMTKYDVRMTKYKVWD